MFDLWLKEQLKKKDWKQIDLANAANLDSAVISNLVNKRRGPGEDTCKAIAHALELPELVVFVAAGIVDPPPDYDERTQELEYLFNQIDEDQQEEVIESIRIKVKHHKKRGDKSETSKAKPALI